MSRVSIWQRRLYPDNVTDLASAKLVMKKIVRLILART